MKEVRNGNLIATIKTTLPNVGHVKLETKDGRKASFVFRNKPFFVSSRLIVKEMGLGIANRFRKATETPEANVFTDRLKQAVS